MDKRSIENRTVSFVNQVAVTCQAIYNKEKCSLLIDNLLNSCVTVGVAINAYEYANSSVDMLTNLDAAQKELNRTQYWIDILYNTGLFQMAEYEQFLSETTELIKLAEETSCMIQH